MPDTALRAHREAVVRAHMDSEDRHDFEETLHTFHRPRYEVVPTGDVHEGAEAVRDFFAESHLAFPDFHFENTRLLHSDEAVIVETEFVGTQLGPWRGLPPTGRTVRYRMCNLFEFEGDHLVTERLYFDLLTVLRQLGIARDPSSAIGRLTAALCHPLTIGGAVWRQLAGR